MRHWCWGKDENVPHFLKSINIRHGRQARLLNMVSATQLRVIRRHNSRRTCAVLGHCVLACRRALFCFRRLPASEPKSIVCSPRTACRVENVRLARVWWDIDVSAK